MVKGRSMSTGETAQERAIPANYEGFVNLITEEYPRLSNRFQQIARFFTQNPNVVALESINAIAAKCEAHPSSLVRFAQQLGWLVIMVVGGLGLWRLGLRRYSAAGA